MFYPRRLEFPLTNLISTGYLEFDVNRKNKTHLAAKSLNTLFSNTYVFFYHSATAPSQLSSSHYREFMITLIQKHHTRQDSSGQVISPTQRPLPYNTQHSQQTNIHASGGIRNSQSQQVSGRRPMPQTARLLGSAKLMNTSQKIKKYVYVVYFVTLLVAQKIQREIGQRLLNNELNRTCQNGS